MNRTGPGYLAAAIGTSFALLLTLLPLPESLSMARPAFLPLVVAYLCLSAPTRFGVGYAWFCGLLLDVAHGAVLGQHALALTLAAYLVLKLKDTIRDFPAWQQACALLPVWAGYQAFLLWLDGLLGQTVDPMWRWIPIASTTAAWLLVSAGFALSGRPSHHTA